MFIISFSSIQHCKCKHKTKINENKRTRKRRLSSLSYHDHHQEALHIQKNFFLITIILCVTHSMSLMSVSSMLDGPRYSKRASSYDAFVQLQLSPWRSLSSAVASRPATRYCDRFELSRFDHGAGVRLCQLYFIQMHEKRALSITGRRHVFTSPLHAAEKGSISELYLEDEDGYQKGISPPEIKSDRNPDDDDEYLKKDAMGGVGNDDAGANEYFGRFISEAIKEEEMIKQLHKTKPKVGTSNSKIDLNSSPSPSQNSHPSQSSVPDELLSASVLDKTMRRMEEQQQQIDLLMKLVQGRQQLSPFESNNSFSIDSIILDGSPSSPDSTPSSSSPLKTQKAINVAPLKAMLFIDGTWLYYSLNTRNPERCAIINKFGIGWQSYYKVDW